MKRLRVQILLVIAKGMSLFITPLDETTSAKQITE